MFTVMGQAANTTTPLNSRKRKHVVKTWRKNAPPLKKRKKSLGKKRGAERCGDAEGKKQTSERSLKGGVFTE